MTIHLVEIGEARTRALTLEKDTGFENVAGYVEIGEARTRALTHSSMAAILSSNFVEIGEARTRALTKEIMIKDFQ